MKTIFVFIPDDLERENIGFLDGFYEGDDPLVFYVTNNKIRIRNDENSSIGYCSENSPQGNFCDLKDSEWLHINNKTGEVKVNNLNSNEDYRITRITYDYNTFRKSEVVVCSDDYGEYLQKLCFAVKRREKSLKDNGILGRIFSLITKCCLVLLAFTLSLLNKSKPITKYSSTITHFKRSIETAKWALQDLQRQRKFTLKTTNFLISRFLDFALGIAFLYYLFLHSEKIMEQIEGTIEIIIKNLKLLLNILMGSPAGLKLNFAFNKTLGTFFFYHISLWRAFLLSINPLLQSTLQALVIPGILGASFQVALFTDLITVITFHMYCIYVYAARLYWLQLRGLISLWKLFIGRKYNPLRARVDSFEYTRHQLFIGTLGFTVLLFLLPTTLLYYSVFTLFRLLLVLLNGMLCKVRDVLQALPLYVVFLWLVRSSKLAGSVKLNVITNESKHQLEANLTTLPLGRSIRSSRINWNGMEKTPSLGVLFQNVITGTLF